MYTHSHVKLKLIKTMCYIMTIYYKKILENEMLSSVQTVVVVCDDHFCGLEILGS